jgi:hypothetical protein
MSATLHLINACAVLAALTVLVGARMLAVRVRDMRTQRIGAQSVALSFQRAQRLSDSRASDNFNHLFEVPVLFYALCVGAIASGHIPPWLPPLAWLFVALRIVHSGIQCSYNKVMHRFPLFLASLVLIACMWIGFAISFNLR